MSFKVPETYRIKEGNFGSHPEIGNNGHFLMPGPFPAQYSIFLEASDKNGIEQVIVSRGKKPPGPKDMALVRALFWSDGDELTCELLKDNRRRRWWRQAPENT